jgi:hypothetical protein
LKRGGSLGRLSRHGSFAADAAKLGGGQLSRGGSLVIDLEAQAISSPASPAVHPPALLNSAPARTTVALQSVPSSGACLPPRLHPHHTRSYTQCAFGRPGLASWHTLRRCFLLLPILWGLDCEL